MRSRGRHSHASLRRETFQTLSAVDNRCPKCRQSWNITEFWEEGKFGMEERTKCRSCRGKLRAERVATATPTDNKLFELRHTMRGDAQWRGPTAVPRIRP